MTKLYLTARLAVDEGPPRSSIIPPRPPKPKPWHPWELLDKHGQPLGRYRLFRVLLDSIRDREPPGAEFRVRRWMRREKFDELQVSWVIWIDPVDLAFRHREFDG